MKISLRLLILLLTLLLPPLFAQELSTQPLKESPLPTTELASPQQQPSIQAQIMEIEENIADLEKRKKAVQTQIRRETDPQMTKTYQDRLAVLQAQQKDFESLFEKLSLGGLDTSRLEVMAEEDLRDYDWKNELIQIIQPVFKEMQRMTEKPRQLERLRTEEQSNQRRIDLINSGLKHLDEISEQELPKKSLERIAQLREHWSTFRNDIQIRQEIIRGEILALEDDTHFFGKLGQSLLEFIKGRGATLVTAILTATLIISLLSSILNYFAKRRERLGRTRRVNVKWRLLVLCYRLITFLIATIAFLVVLHTMGDMVLFGLAFLILFVALLSFRTYVPRYISELRIYLNLGQVRQGERTIYNGIPWKVDRINLYSSYLVNPSLNNGRIRLTMNLMRNLVSRKIEMDELWFPCQVGDSLLLNDGTYVEVLRQTPEAVYLDAFHSQIIYPTPDFIAMRPKNISKGFYSIVNFGLSYEHFNLPTELVFAKIKAKVEEMLARPESEVGDAIQKVKVEFRQVNEGVSLLYTVIIEVHGSAAPSYYRIPRIVQEACLKTAQEEGWSMPSTEVSLQAAPLKQ